MKLEQRLEKLEKANPDASENAHIVYVEHEENAAESVARQRREQGIPDDAFVIAIHWVKAENGRVAPSFGG